MCLARALRTSSIIENYIFCVIRCPPYLVPILSEPYLCNLIRYAFVIELRDLNTSRYIENKSLTPQKHSTY